MREPLEQLEIRFAAPELTHPDFVRMGRQRSEVWAAMLPGGWWTLAELAAHTGHPEASISARLRDFRRPKFGGHAVDRRRRNGPGTGTWEYRLTAEER